MFPEPTPLREISRPKLYGPGEHVGVQLPTGYVAHKTQDGIKIEPLHAFAQGLPVTEKRRATSSTFLPAQARFQDALQTMHQYDVLDSNCEHFASYVLTGKKESRQINFLILAGIAGIWAALAG